MKCKNGTQHADVLFNSAATMTAMFIKNKLISMLTLVADYNLNRIPIKQVKLFSVTCVYSEGQKCGVRSKREYLAGLSRKAIISTARRPSLEIFLSEQGIL